MPTALKIVLTIVLLGFCVGLYLVDPKGENPWPRQLMHRATGNLLFKTDGTLRKTTKPIFYLFFLTAIVIIWA
jgi:hypothetical protein